LDLPLFLGKFFAGISVWENLIWKKLVAPTLTFFLFLNVFNNFFVSGPNPQILYGALVGGPNAADDKVYSNFM